MTVLVTTAMIPVSVLAATQADAVRSTGGSATFPHVEWVSWGAPGASLIPNASGTITRVESFTAGGQTFETTCVLSNLVRLGGSNQSGKPSNAIISAWRSGTWQGDGLDDLYALPSGAAPGILNIHDGNTVEFDVACQVELVVGPSTRVPVPTAGLVMAQAESAVSGATSSGTVQEYIGATIPAGGTWRVLDRVRGASCTQQTYARHTVAGGGTRLELRGALDDSCEGSNAAARPNPTVVALADGVMSVSDVTIRGRGFEAVAFGVVLPFDFGDAPAGYGVAGALALARFSGGTVPNYTSGNGTSMFGSFSLAQQVQPNIGLGASVSYESASAHNASATGDGNDNAMASPGTLNVTPGGTYTLPNVQCRATASSPAHVAGWIDWHGDGTFGAEDASATVTCPTGGGTVSLVFDVPTSMPATPTVASFVRLRTAPTGTALTPTGVTLEGEVEDYAATLQYPVTPALEIDKTHTGGEVVAGQTLAFTLEVTNTGNVPLANVAVSDPTATVSGCSWATLAAGATQSCSATYVVDSDDVAAGLVTNTATATALYSGSPITPAEDTVTVYADLVAQDDTDTTTVAVAITRDAANGVLVNDSGAGLDVVAFTPVDAGEGSLTINADGSYTFTPAPGFSGVVTSDYTVESSNGDSTTATLTITVTPTAADDVESTPANTPVDVDVTDNDAGSGLDVVSVTQPANGTASINPDGTVEYDPATGFSGTDTFTYTVEDDEGQQVTATVTVTVTPTAADDSETTSANTAVDVDVTANDAGTALDVVSVTQPANGTASINADGTVEYDPATGFSGTDTFTYTVEDDEGQQTTATVTVTVTPTASNDAESTPVNTPVDIDVTDNDAGTGLEVVSATDPSNGEILDNGDGTFTYTPDTGFSGVDTFTYTVEDDEGQQVTATVTVNVTPTAGNDGASTPVNTPFDIDVTANDIGTALDVVSVTQPANGTASINPDGTVEYAPDTGFTGTDTFTYTVEDDEGQQATATVTVTVGPEATDDAETIPANTTIAVDVTDNDAGTGLEVVSITQPANGAADINLDGTVQYTPDADFSGTDTFTYTVEDDEGQQTTATVTVTVTPTAADDAESTPANTAVDVDVADNDAGSGLDVVSVTQPANGTASVTPDGTVEYDPATGFSGTDTFTYTVEDDEGQQTAATVTVTVTPTASNDAESTPVNTPVDIDVTDNDAGTGLEVVSFTDPSNGEILDNGDGTFTYTPDTGFSGVDTFTYTVEDDEGQQVTATVTVSVTPTAADDAETIPANTTVAAEVTDNDAGTGLEIVSITQPSHGVAVINLDGTVQYTPDADFSGTDTLTYTVEDDEGQQVGATVTVTVTPTASNDAESTPANTPVDVDVTDNDAGSGLDVVAVTQPANGTASINPDGTVEYAPGTDFSGTDTFTYTVEDDEGQQVTATVTVTVGPNVVNDAETIPANTTVAVDVTDNDGGTGLEVVSITQPSYGVAVINLDGTVQYTPAADFSGTDTLTYTVEDDEGQQVTATVTMTVTPTAADDSESTPANTAVDVDVTDNDAGSGLDVVSVTQPANGTASINPDGTVEYAPGTDFSGTDTFTYTVEDDEGQQTTATVTVTVTPTAVDDAESAPANTPVDVDVTANDAGSGLDVVAVTQPANGTASIKPDGTVEYDPATGFSGTDTFTYTVEDDEGQQVTATVSVTVTPTASDDAESTPANTPVDVDVTDNDAGSGLDVVSVTQPANGTASINPDGTVEYAPATGFSGTDTFTYTVEDDEGQQVAATVSVTVTPTAADDAESTPVNTPLDIDVTDNDAGTGLEVVSSTNPSNGEILDNGDGTFTYTPDTGFSGVDTFTYTVEDDEGQQVTATVTMTVTPTAADDAESTPANTPVNVAVKDNDAGSGLDVVAVTQPANGTASINPDGTVEYAPATGFSGTDTFTYTVEDDEGQQATATVTVSVTPTSVDDSATTPSGTAVLVQVRANDAGTALTVTTVSAPSHGTAFVTPGGDVGYTPSMSFSGTDTFTYTVVDGEGQETTATVTVTVTPLATNNAVSTPGGTPVRVDAENGVLGNDGGTGIRVVGHEPVPADQGALVLNEDGSYVFTPAPGFSGVVSVVYTIEDADGNRASAVLSIEIGAELPLVLGSAAAQCAAATPYLTWDVELPEGFPDQGANPLMVTFVNPDGDDYVLTDLPLEGRTLWPGASDEEPLQWPGWERLADGTYAETDGNYRWTRGAIEVRLEVNPEVTTTVSYPTEASDCANPPEDADGGDLASTGTEAARLALFAAALVGVGALLLFGARRRSDAVQ
ncbi:CshA/CshB family fibrillar adhesin-related protein [Demequina sp. NBRC 110053]|uniref:CshA/CshB family fibrillar adhesin-related protein n=1 Tax=Demequina sp. NBRC 110053 TaxID=1570342 RepID=UPI0011860005|nr:CshA/CshB family fibrillar adhesin-related protein [Demequina sp. NBRC 110053]